MDILVVEDDLDTWFLIEASIGAQFSLRHCQSIQAARAALEGAKPRLILLDIELPDGDGLALCSELRNDASTRAIPVFFLSSRSSVDTKVTAFGLDADDYLSKPFDSAELRARVGARLRRTKSLGEQGALRVFGPLRIDRDRFKAHVMEGGNERDLDLTAHELRLLAALAEAPGRVLSRGQLAQALVGDCVITERTIDTHLCNLRRKLGAHRNLLETVRGAGYRFAEPREPSAPH